MLQRILVIDDDPLVGGSVKTLLQKQGFGVSVASMGLAALDLALREDFDLIISDVRMPGMNGILTLQSINDLRRQFRKPSLPLMILTAYEDKTVRETARKLGVRDFFLKPFELEPFLAAVRQNLQGKKTRRRLRMNA